VNQVQVRPLSYLPNLLSSLRVALAPGMLGAAYSNSKTGFLLLLGIALVTDALDGFFARRWDARSDMGRRLDHWGDALTMILGAVGIYFLWPLKIESEWQASLLALVGYAVLGIDRLWRRPDLERTPTVVGRISALLVPISLVLLIAEWSPWPFRAAATLQALIALKTLMAGSESSGSTDDEQSSVEGLESGSSSKGMARTMQSRAKS
jgi:cardiolipin synthase (CMP-forming)